MCTYINHQSAIAASGKGGGAWIPLTQLSVGFDHPVSAPLGHAVLVDFLNPGLDSGARVALEMDIASATTLMEQLQATIAEAEKTGLAE
jgi:hypothetical protein